MQVTGLNSWKSWGAALACFIISMLSLAPFRLSGLLYVGFIERYNVSRNVAAFPILMSYALRCLFGPVIGYLGKAFGCRTLIFWGSILVSAGIGGCCFAEKVHYAIISLGLVYGIGLALSNPLLPVILSQHFDKHLANANGLNLTGPCLAAFIICPIYEYFLEEYGFPGALLLISGIMLNALPAAIFLKTPNYVKETDSDNEPRMNEIKKHRDISTKKSWRKRSSIIQMCNQKENKKIHNFIDGELYPDTDVGNSAVKKTYSHTIGSSVPITYADDALNLSIDISSEMGVMNAPEVPKTITTLKEKSQKAENRISFPEEFHKSESSNTKMHSKKVNSFKVPWNSLSLFIDPSYIIIMLDQTFAGCILATIWIIMIDMSRDKGIPRSLEIYFLVFLPVVELFGYVGFGWIIDGGYMTSVNFCCSFFICLALTCVYLSWSHSFITMFIGILFFGVFGSALHTGLIPLVHNFVEKNNLSIALSSRHFLLGVFIFFMSPMIEYFRGKFGSYDWVLYVLVILSLISTAITFFLPHIATCTSKRKQPNNEKQENNDILI